MNKSCCWGYWRQPCLVGTPSGPQGRHRMHRSEQLGRQRGQISPQWPYTRRIWGEIRLRLMSVRRGTKPPAASTRSFQGCQIYRDVDIAIKDSNLKRWWLRNRLAESSRGNDTMYQRQLNLHRSQGAKPAAIGEVNEGLAQPECCEDHLFVPSGPANEPLIRYG